VASLVSRRWSIYLKQVPSRIDSNAHRGDFFVDVLGAIRVIELMPYVRKVELIPEDMTFSEFKTFFSSTQQHYFPVVNKENQLTGIFSINDVRGVLFTPEIEELVVMRDIATSDIIFTTPSEDLNEVLKKFTIRNLHRLPVVKDEDHTRLLGMLDRREVIQHYNQRVQEIKTRHQRIDIVSDQEISQMKSIMVRQAMSKEITTIDQDTPLKDLKDLFFGSKFRSFPVVAGDERLVGIISFTDLEKFPIQEGKETLSAKDLATQDVVTVREDDTLFQALSKITQGDFAILPVIADTVSMRLVGVISRRDIVSCYDDMIIKRRPLMGND
jgi:CIC family chloride channel protein